MPSRSQSDWREAADYEWLLQRDRSAWGWEWLRRNRHYRRSALAALEVRTSQHPPAGEPGAEHWGLHRFEDPLLDARHARPVWTAAVWPFALQLDAKPVEDGEGFDILALGHPTLVTGAAEHWLEQDGGHALRIDVRTGTLTSGPARLCVELPSPCAIRNATVALGQLAELWLGRKLPPGPALSAPRATRLLRLLRVGDALAAGASQRSIAEVLISPRVRGPRWRLEQASVRLQAQRLVRNARNMAEDGYRRILSGSA